MSYNPLDLLRPDVKVSVTVRLGDPDAEPIVDVIDYSKEPGPFYYVYCDGTPLSPDVPLPYALAERKLAELEAEAAENGGVERFEIEECTAGDLKWAGVTPREGSS